MNVAWFSPLPPSTSGIAAYSAELLPAMRLRHRIDTFVDAASLEGTAEAPALTKIGYQPSDEEKATMSAYAAPDFVPQHRRAPYDLVVYQLGNAACHNYMWGYLFHYPGLVVLHDAQLHQARALFLTKRYKPRLADYLAEFHANHPEAPEDVARLVAAGLGGTLFTHWPLLRLVLESARLTAVHNQRLARDLQDGYPRAVIHAIPMGVPALREGGLSAAAIRDRHAIPAEAVVVAAFGGVTPEKRVPLLMDVFSALAHAHPSLHLLLVGAHAEHLDIVADARQLPARERVHVTGFVPDEELSSYMRASDMCVCLRWPTNRETSASWLRCLSAGCATVISDLAHLVDVPTLDPRHWGTLSTRHEDSSAPVAVSVDVLDERHSLQLAIERLAVDSTLRARLGQAGQAWWQAHHRLELMVDAYQTLLDRAASLPVPSVFLPAHLTDDGTRLGEALLTAFGPDTVARAGVASDGR